MRVVVPVLVRRRPALLLKLLEQFAFRKALGAEARLLALRSLGVEIGEDVCIGARVMIRAPENLTVGDRTRLRGAVLVDSWLPVRFGHDVLVEEHTALLSCEHDVNSPTFQWTGGAVDDRRPCVVAPPGHRPAGCPYRRGCGCRGRIDRHAARRAVYDRRGQPGPADRRPETVPLSVLVTLT
jgi:hypothetical protein